MAVDAAGAIYVAGHTSSTDFPTVNARWPGYGGGPYDGLAMKIAPAHDRVDYATYLGGSGTDLSDSLAVDALGNATIGGNSDSPDFPTRGALQAAPAGGRDLTVTRLDPAGGLTWSTYLGGAASEAPHSLALDSSGAVYLTGNTRSANFPTASPLQPAYGGSSSDAFLAELAPGGDALRYSSFLGGTGGENGYGIVVDGARRAYVAGGTSSPDFPTAVPHQAAKSAGSDAFLAVFDMAAPTPAPKAPPPPRPVVTLKAPGRERALKKGRVYVRARSDQAATIVARGTLRVSGVSKRLKLRSASRTVAGGSFVRLDLKLSKSVQSRLRKALRNRRSVVARITAVATGAGGRSHTAARTIRIVGWQGFLRGRFAPARGEADRMTTKRLEAFSDGVFAVAITLLVLDLHVPNPEGLHGSLSHALGQEWPSYAAYAVSFLVIGIIWVNHHAVMDLMARANRQLAFLNLIVLMTVVLIPFATALMAKYLRGGNADAHFAAAAYSAVMLAMGASFGGLWIYGSHVGKLIVPGFTDAELRRITLRFTAGTPLYVVALGVAFISAPACLALHAVLALFYALSERGVGMTRPAALDDPPG